MNSALGYFRAWMGSPQALPFPQAVEYAKETMEKADEVIGELELGEEVKPFFVSLIEGLIVSTHHHPKTETFSGGPVTCPDDAINLACDWLEALSFAEGVALEALTPEELKKMQESEADGMKGILENG
jgi:hypothetical protein